MILHVRRICEVETLERREHPGTHGGNHRRIHRVARRVQHGM